jgi:hypothetical protein
MTATEIIAKFELYVDDTTELSSAEELALLNKIYYRVSSSRAWEILKKEASGTMASTTTITLPSDFEHFTENYGYTDNQMTRNLNTKGQVVFVGGNPFFIVNWSDRKQYENNNGVCYLDIRNSVIKFPVAQSASATYSFDYKYTPTALTAGTSPVFPERFHDLFYHAMAVDDMIIQIFDKARSYARENEANYQSILGDMTFWNANLQNI